MVTIVRYFGNLTGSLFVLEIYASMIQNKRINYCTIKPKKKLKKGSARLSRPVKAQNLKGDRSER